MADIAAVAGVSKNAVSLALMQSPQIPVNTRKRIERIAKRMGYQKNPVVGELMSRLRQSGTVSHRMNVALINANEDAHAFHQHPTIPDYVRGCKLQAKVMGCALDTFWLHDPELRGKQLARIFRTRGIRGALIVGLMKQNHLPEDFLPLVDQFPCVVMGVRTVQPALSFVCVDHHRLLLTAFERALELGFRRPGLVLDGTIDRLVEGRFSSGYWMGQQNIPTKQRIRPFYEVELVGADLKPFETWLQRNQPDVIFTLYNSTKQWLEKLGYQLPDEMGLVQLEWREKHASWAGMNQHNDIVGKAALDMLISKIHKDEIGIPEFPTATLIGATWVDGASIRSLA